MNARATGLALGVLADSVFADPRRGHPVAGFGRVAAALERRCLLDSVSAGAVFTAVCVGAPVALGSAVARRHPGGAGAVLTTAVATWAVLGGTSLARQAQLMHRHLEAEDLAQARARLGHLCARNPDALGRDELARATVESVAENTSDAVVAPLCWGAVAGVPGLLGYRAINTLDAMIGYRNDRYLRFGRAAARTDDLVNLIPARLTGVLTVLAAPVVGGRIGDAARVLRADRRAHPSPNAGWCEAAAAGALGIRLGGTNSYPGYFETRPVLGAGGAPVQVQDIPRAVRLSRTVGAAAAGIAVLYAARRR